jgi:hypothetical protein
MARQPRDGSFGVMDVDHGRSAMGKPTKIPRKKHHKVKAGEITASTGKPRRSPAPKANPVADQTNWRRKLQAGSIKFDDAAKEIFLAEYAEHNRKKHAATAAGVSVITVTLHCKNDPNFAHAYDEAQAAYRDKFVEHAIGDLAFKGNPIMRATKEGVVYEEKREFPVPLIAMELKRIDAGYRDKQEVNLTGGGGVLVVPAAMTPAEWVADQARKNEERQNPMQADAEKPGEDASANVAKEVVLPDRAADVAARKAGKAVVR